ncbi:FlgB family protein [Sulfitobacter sp. S190]|uniref:FlgB family protein n=1 Tax=Sulfitobacter sp. S190 TaxID=2867022 RepID=UPI0021A7CF68|nr:FlgB family protein [Sulfitobacter sp. S190]UWR22375.1 FlgB family protein [Sulfitobacter sp. S190]
MFENLDIFRMSSEMARHAGQQQAIISHNVANADTPGFKARRMAEFATTYQAPNDAPGARATRATHLHGTVAGQLPDAQVRTDGGGSPNKNTVSLEVELVEAAGAKSQHDRALAIYKSALDVLHATLRR